MRLFHRRGVTFRYAFIQGYYWVIYCVLISFSSVYLLEQGLSNQQIGFLLGGANLCSTLLQPFLAAWVDRLRRFTLVQVSVGLSGGMAVGAAGLLLAAGPWAQVGLYGFLLVALQLFTPLSCALGADCLNQNLPLDYGLARGMGAMSYGLASLLCGGLAAWLSPSVLPLVCAGASVLLAGSVSTFPAGRPEQAERPAGQARAPSFLKRHRLYPFLLAVTLLFVSHNILMSFPYQIVRSLGGGSGEMGALLLVECAMDLPAMVFFSWLLRRKSSRVWLQVSGVAFFLHGLFTWLAADLPQLFLAQIFECAGYGLYAAASVYFINEVIPPEERVQGQTCLSVTNTVGMVLAAAVGGVLLDRLGVSALLGLSALSGGVGCLLLLYALHRRRFLAQVRMMK